MKKEPALFREEAIRHQGPQILGKVLCVGPVSALVWSLLFSLAVILLLLFLWLGHYQPEVRVSGILVPDKGMDYIYAPASGTVDKVDVAENAVMEKGKALLSMRVDNNLSGIAPSRQQLPLLENQIALQQHMLGLQKKQLSRLEQLMKKSAVSEVSVQHEQQVVLNTQTTIKQLQQQYAALQGQQSADICAPEAGTLAALLVAPGMHITQNQPVAVMLPEHSRLEVELFVPSRAMRSVYSGQEVLLRYSTYPWQQYGVYKGSIVSVGSVLLEPGEVRYSHNIKQPFFLIKVKLDSPFVKVNNHQVALKPGMQLSASLLLPEVTLWRWIFHPLT